MKELLELIVKGIVNTPSAVVVVERESVDFPGLKILEVEVAAEDKGILIGRRGRTINAIRDLITISAIRNNVRVKVLVKDDQRGEGPRKERSAEPMSAPVVKEAPEAVASDSDVEDILSDDNM